MSSLPLTDPNDIREHNLRLVLDIIRQAGEISRADIARLTQLSRSTITNLVNELLPTDLVVESGTATSFVGRRPTILRFQQDARALLGVDMGTTHLTVVITNLAGQVKAQRHRPFTVAEQPDATLDAITGMAREVIAEAQVDEDILLGAGIGIPAPLEGERQERPSAIIMPHWVGVDIRRELHSALRLPVQLDNDANLGALAEKWWGHGRDVSNLAYIKVGTGVGSGLIINGSIFRGEGGTAGEIGHTAIDPNGPLCRCGLSGCLESLTGAPAIVTAVAERFGAQTPPYPLTVAAISEAARAGDPIATEVVQRAGRYLGIAIANLLNLVNPGLIVLGGDLTHAGDALLGPLRQAVRERTFAKSNTEATITTSRLGDDSIAIGAATLVLERLFTGVDGALLSAIAPPTRAIVG